MITPKSNINNQNIGLLTKSIAGSYYVEAGDAMFVCTARGVLKNKNEIPLAGDFVEFDRDKSLITSILPRKNELVRPSVANVDNLIIVSSFTKPAPSTLFIDKLSVIALSKKIRPVVVFNKCDLGDFSELVGVYNKAG
ncbi:MAG: GTPase RsgA, partial [Oscillospiraceae bacterium]|nr:GTPase RsgA [Candidatus Equicaccousia limihippi]